MNIYTMELVAEAHRFAHDHPDIGSLVLMSPASSSQSPMDGWVYAVDREWLEEIMRMSSADPKNIVWLECHRLFRGHFADEALADLLKQIR